MLGIKRLSKVGFMNTICNLCTYVICRSQINLNCLVISCEIMAAELRVFLFVFFKKIHDQEKKPPRKNKQKTKQNKAIVDEKARQNIVLVE